MPKLLIILSLLATLTFASSVEDKSFHFKEQKALILSQFDAQKSELSNALVLIEKSDDSFLASFDLDKNKSLKLCSFGKEIFELFSICMRDAKNGDGIEKCNKKLQDQKHYSPLIDDYLSFYHALALQYSYAKANKNQLSQFDEEELKIKLDDMLSLLSSHTTAMDSFIETLRIKNKKNYPFKSSELLMGEKISDDIYRIAGKFLTLKEKSQKQKIYDEYLELLFELQEKTKQLYTFEQKFKNYKN